MPSESTPAVSGAVWAEDQHSGDSWLLHRGAGEGSLATICDRIWRALARSLLGLQVTLLTLPPESPQQGQLQFQLMTGDIDRLRAGGGEALPGLPVDA